MRISSSYERVGILRHEIGHILGFRHEQVQGAGGCVAEDGDWKAITPYDPKSVMHYYCGLAGTLLLEHEVVVVRPLAAVTRPWKATAACMVLTVRPLAAVTRPWKATGACDHCGVFVSEAWSAKWGTQTVCLKCLDQLRSKTKDQRFEGSRKLWDNIALGAALGPYAMAAMLAASATELSSVKETRLVMRTSPAVAVRPERARFE